MASCLRRAACSAVIGGTVAADDCRRMANDNERVLYRFHRERVSGYEAFALSRAGRSASVIGNVNSTTAATTINADGTPTASPSKP
jgi:hypothetical protein